MRYQLIVWDFDGTLADTLACALRIYNQLAEQHGFRPVEDPNQARSLTIRQLLTQHRIPLTKVPRLIGQFIAAQKAEMSSVRLFPGLAAALSSIRSQGCR